MRFSNLSLLVLAEMRLFVRLARTWVFYFLTGLTCIGYWIVLGVIHGIASPYFPSAGALAPIYLIHHMGGLILALFAFGTALLVFAEGKRRPLHSETDSGEPSQTPRLEALTGKLLGAVGLMFFLAIGLVVFVCGLGWLLDSTNASIGSSIEPISVLAFFVWDLIPNFLLWGSLAILLNSFLKSGWLIATIVLAISLLYYLVYAKFPSPILEPLTFFMGQNSLPTELAPTFFSSDILLNRTAILLVSFGFFLLGAGMQSRKTDSEQRIGWLFTGLAPCLAGLIMLLGLVYAKYLDQQQVRKWALAHAKLQTHSLTDIRKISGSVVVRPGTNVRLDVTLTLDPNTESSDDEWLLSLNPGYRLQQLHLDGSETENYTFSQGLLTIPIGDSRESEADVRIVAQGKPDSRFAYLDATLDTNKLNRDQRRKLFPYGNENLIFHRGYFVLMHGVNWLPTSGAAYGRTAWETRRQDFFQVDIEVSVPKKWLVAGPGSRVPLEETGKSRYRFSPEKPVPEVTLIGSNFERRAVTVDGVDFEVLLHRRHTKNFNVLKTLGDPLREWIDEATTRLRRGGLGYPYGTLSVVEVPNCLRSYGGGWQMASTYSSPGLLMLRESGLPIARLKKLVEGRRFDRMFDEAIAEAMESSLQGTRSSRAFSRLVNYLQRDSLGSNPIENLPKQLVSYQTSLEGKGATALKHVVEDLAAGLIDEHRGYFSVHTALKQEDENWMARVDAWMDLLSPFVSPPDHREKHVNTPSAWTEFSEISPSSIDFESDPEFAYRALLFRTAPVAESIATIFKSNQVPALLRELLDNYRGRTFTQSDFHRTALEVGIDIDALVGDWLNDPRLPGFVVAEPELEQLTRQDGSMHYQASFTLRNTEPVPGVVELIYQHDDPESSTRYHLEPIQVDANTSLRVAFTSWLYPARPPAHVWVTPIFSLNRGSIRIELPPMDDSISTSETKLPYTSVINWNQPNSTAIIVDDLDAGFSVNYDPTAPVSLNVDNIWLFSAQPRELDLDHGLPRLDDALPSMRLGGEHIVQPIDRGQPWFRDYHPTSYGKYRHTYAVTTLGVGQTRPKFSATLPTLGNWKLEFHIPSIKLVDLNFRFHKRSPDEDTRFVWPGKLGMHQVLVDTGSNSTSVQIEADVVDAGWFEMGTFEVDSHDVEVRIEEISEGWGVADAIRWTPIDE